MVRISYFDFVLPKPHPFKETSWAYCVISGRLGDRLPSMIDHADFSGVVKNRASPPKPWRWEIYRAGSYSPIKQFEIFFELATEAKIFFELATEANRAGKLALKPLLSEYPN